MRADLCELAVEEQARPPVLLLVRLLLVLLGLAPAHRVVVVLLPAEDGTELDTCDTIIIRSARYLTLRILMFD